MAALLKTVSAAAVLATQVATSSYQVTEIYDTTNFFDKFNFVTAADPNGGYVRYQSRSDAERLGLVKYKDGAAHIGVDYTRTDYDASGVGRKSVRLESKNVYNHGLIIADFTHLPKPTCGSWPAYWFFGEPWPTKGEVDVYENWNDLEFNRHTAHVDAPSIVGDCKIVPDGMTSTIDSPNCYDFADGQAEYQGCSAEKTSSTFGSSTGGVYALQWTSDYLKIWEWSHLLTPIDVTLGKPVPSLLWGTPSFLIKRCDIDAAFKDMKMVLNIDFCAVAGQTDKWASCKASTGYNTCAAYVAKKASAFSNTNFKVRDIKVYQLKDTTSFSATLSTSSASVTSSATASASASYDPSSSSTASYAITGSSSAVYSTATSSASYSATSSTVSDDEEDYCTDDETSSSYIATSTSSYDDEDYCTDDDEATSSSYVVSPTVSVSATTTASSDPYITPAPGNSYVVSGSAPNSASGSEYSEMTTSTIYATSVYTVTSCAASITNCPANGGSYVTTEVVSVGVTVCPVTATEGSSPEATTTGVPVPAPEGYATSTVEVTKTYTITSCAASVTNCPVGKVTTEVGVTTAVYPIGNGSPAASTGTPAGNTGSGSTPVGSTGSGSTGSGSTGSGNTGSGNTGSGSTGSGNTGSGSTGSGNTGATTVETTAYVATPATPEATSGSTSTVVAGEGSGSSNSSSGSSNNSGSNSGSGSNNNGSGSNNNGSGSNNNGSGSNNNGSGSSNSGSGSNSGSNSGSSGSSSETDVYVTATVVPVTSANPSYSIGASSPSAMLTAVTASAAGVASSSASYTAATGAATTSAVVEVSAGVKTGASLALAGVAAFFLFAM